MDTQNQMYIDNQLPPVLSREEEFELGKKLKSKNRKIVKEARLKLVEHNLRLVTKIVQDYIRFRGRLEFEDLVNEGNIGLIKAAEKFDVDKGVKFSTYSAFWVKQQIRRALGNNSRVVSIPCELQRVAQKIKVYSEKFEERFGHRPTKKTVQKQFGVSDAIVEHAFSYADSVTSFQIPIGKPDTTHPTTLQDLFEDENSTSPSEVTEYNSDISFLESHIDKCLTKREKRIVRLRFGLETGEPLTLEKVSDHIGVTRERIRQIVDLSVHKLQKSYQRSEYVKSH
jgi:RNA polymerase primary sigma factor